MKCMIIRILSHFKHFISYFFIEGVAMSGTPFRTTDHTREWSGRNTSPSVDPGAGNPVSKPGQLQCACSALSKRGN